MNKNTKNLYCYNCNKDVEYITSTINKEVEVRGVKFVAPMFEARCKYCNELVSNDEIDRINDVVIYDIYKKKVGLLTSNEIRLIRKKKGFTQIQLARFINIGDKDIARYENGAIQTKNIDLLLRLVDNDKMFKEIENIHAKEADFTSKDSINEINSYVSNLLDKYRR